MKKSLKTNSYLLISLIFSTVILLQSELHAFTNYIINSSNSPVKLRIRYGGGSGEGVYLPVNSTDNSEFFLLNPNEILEIEAKTDPKWLAIHSPLKIRITQQASDLKMDIDFAKNIALATSVENQPFFAPKDIDFTEYNENYVFVFNISRVYTENFKNEKNEIKTRTVCESKFNIASTKKSTKTPGRRSNNTYVDLSSFHEQNSVALEGILESEENRDKTRVKTKTISYKDLIENIKRDRNKSWRTSKSFNS